MNELWIKWIVLLEFNVISTFALKPLLIVIKPYEPLIDCWFVPINCDTSDCTKVTHVDNTSNQLF